MGQTKNVSIAIWRSGHVRNSLEILPCNNLPTTTPKKLLLYRITYKGTPKNSSHLEMSPT
jgi:hypothetical protein